MRKLLIFAVVAFFSFGCKTTKNTWLSRNYQTMTAKYNVYYNGEEAFLKGKKAVENAVEDDYTKIIQMYAYSNHDKLSIASSDMDRAVEKSKKLIKLHSIKVKPRSRPNRNAKKSELDWYNQEEFNPMVEKAYILSGKAYFYKGQFMEAIGVFNYVTRHFITSDVRFDALIWMGRCYSELGWYYEADDILKKANDEKLPYKYLREYNAAVANMYLLQKKYNDGLPYLKEAIRLERDKTLKRRWSFILAQIYQKNENFDDALNAYREVIKMNPPYNMALNARIKLTEVTRGANDTKGIEKDLKKMIRDEKNKEFLDQLYYALANLRLNSGDIVKAAEYYDLSVEKSVNNRSQKGLSQYALAQYYYKNGLYQKAQPYMSGAASNLPDDYPDVIAIRKLSGVLGTLAKYYGIIAQQDSLQRVANMNQADRTKLIEGIIQNLIKEEKAAEKLAKSNKPPVTGATGGANAWYFFNPNLVAKGKQDFQRTWGQRANEDDWRRSEKGAITMGNDLANLTKKAAEIPDSLNNKAVAFYLKGLPFEPAQVKKSNEQMADAYYGIGSIFNNDLTIYPKAIDAFGKLTKRFEGNKNECDALFGMYRAFTKLEKPVQADSVKAILLAKYPDSRYAVIMNDPLYAQKMAATKQAQDSVYYATLALYKKGNMVAVANNCDAFKKNYKGSPLIPYVKFVNALAIASAKNVVPFTEMLKDLKQNHAGYPFSEMVNYMLVQLDSGRVPVGIGVPLNFGLNGTNVATGGSTITKADEKPLFSSDKTLRHYFIVMFDEKKINRNQLLFEVGKFNFNNFMVNDFDISFNTMKGDTSALIVNGFASRDEALWYLQSARNNVAFGSILAQLPVELFVISDENFRQMITQRAVSLYRDYYHRNIAPLEGKVEAPAPQPLPDNMFIPQ